ncbi:MAG: SH3 domain-containing protein, partial [Mariprofundaceae bacterium]
KLGVLSILVLPTLLACLLAGPAFAASGGLDVAGVNLSYPYVINLESSLRPIDQSAQQRLKESGAYRLYTTSIELDGKLWHRLRLGFFPDKKEASAALNKLKKNFPQAWIAKASKKERVNSAQTAIWKGRVKSAPVLRTSPPPALTAPPENILTRMFKKTEETIAVMFSKSKQATPEPRKPPEKQVTPIKRLKTHLKVHSQPTTNSKTIGALRPLETAALLRSVSDWYEIKLDNGKTGFVSQAWTRIQPAQTGNPLTQLVKQTRDAILTAFQRKPDEKPEKALPAETGDRVAQLKQQTLEEVKKTFEQMPPEMAVDQLSDKKTGRLIVPVSQVKNHLNVRKRPDANSIIIGKLKPDEAAKFVAQETGWYQVSLSDGSVGFVSRAWTQFQPVKAEAAKLSLMQQALQAVSNVFKSAEEAEDKSAIQSDFRLVQLMRQSQQAVTKVLQPHIDEPESPSLKVDDEAEKLMEQARIAMTKGDYSRASSLYTAVLQIPDHKDRPRAQEYLALARERMGQFAHAKAEYEKYLKLYPKGDGAQRVSQRLAGLLTMTTPAQKKLAKKEKRKRKPSWTVYGSFSQHQRVDASQYKLNARDLTVNQSELVTDLNAIGRFRSSDYDIRTQFAGGYDHDFLRSNNDDFRISSMFVDVKDKRFGLSARIGRQTRSSGGVLGRFDGALASYQLTPLSRVNLVAGYTVESSRVTHLASNNYFYGAQVELGPFFKAWNFSAFGIRQKIDGIVDRQAIGGEFRYLQRDRSLVGLIDYDITYKTLNTFMLLGHWTLPNKSTFNVMFDNRTSPILTAVNALQGQPVRTIEELLATLSEDEIHALAKDRTADSRLISIGYSKPLMEKLRISTDFTVSTLSGTPASSGVLAVQGLGNDYFTSLQLITSGLLMKRDSAIFGLRYSSNSTSDIWSGSINTRYPFGRTWLVNPKVRIEYRSFNLTEGGELSVIPALRLSYVFRKRYHFDLDGSAEWYRLQQRGTTDKALDFFMNAGYRVDF